MLSTYERILKRQCISLKNKRKQNYKKQTRSPSLRKIQRLEKFCTTPSLWLYNLNSITINRTGECRPGIP